MILTGRKIAILAERNYNTLELWYPLYRMKEEGATVKVVGSGGATQYESKVGLPVKVDVQAEDVSGKDFDAVIIPGGYAPDYMRRHEAMLKLVREIDEKDGVIAMICHAAWVAISAGVIKGKMATCVSSIKDDLENAGGIYVDREVVKDENIISSRGPNDLPAFCRTIIEELS